MGCFAYFALFSPVFGYIAQDSIKVVANNPFTTDKYNYTLVRDGQVGAVQATQQAPQPQGRDKRTSYR